MNFEIGFTSPCIPRFSSPAQLMTHFLDISHDVPKTDLDIENLKGIFKNKAWSDLPVIMKLKGNPNFDYKTQYFIQEQSNGNYTLIKHVYLTTILERTYANVQCKDLIGDFLWWIMMRPEGTRRLHVGVYCVRGRHRSTAMAWI